MAISAVMAIVAACGGDEATVEPTFEPPSTPVGQGREQATVTAALPTSIPAPTATRDATQVSDATLVVPSPTPGPFAISPEATPVPIAPSLLRLSPDEAAPGDEIEVEGSGGHIELRTADGSRIGFIESSTDFKVFLGGESIGSINCFVNTCRGTVVIPQETPPGVHQISVEGGSSLTFTVPAGSRATGEAEALSLAAADFSDGDAIPVRYSCEGEDISPALAWRGVPPGAETLVVIMDDPDAPRGTWEHWVVFNIPAALEGLEEAQPDTPQLPNGGVHGKNSWGDSAYGGPCPPSGPAHNYRFFLYAVAITLDLETGASKGDVLEAIDGHIVGESHLTGTFGR